MTGPTRLLASSLSAPLAITCALLAVRPGMASENHVFRLNSAGDLESGTSEGIAIGAGGTLTLAPVLRPMLPARRPDLGRSLFWCLAVEESGTVWLGSGGDGEVIRIPATGDPAIAASFRQPHVTAIAADPKGGVVAGTSPNGSIYSIRPGAAPTVLFDPGERYIWALQFGRDGTLYAGTGERGRIYAVSPAGEGRILFDGDDPHIITLALDRQARLLAGTAGRGVVIRFGEDGSARTIFDSNGREITGLAVDGAGNVLIGALAPAPSDLGPSTPGLRLRLGEARRGEANPDSVSLPPVDIGGSAPSSPQEITAVLEEGATVRVFPSLSGPRSEVIRLTPSGGLESLWRSAYESIFALAAAPDGSAYVATGEPAGIRRIENSGSAPLLVRLPESQVTALAIDRQGSLFLASSNAGNAYRLGPGGADRGTFTSRPLDAGFTARWGAVSWDARTPPGARVSLSTRTGSSPDPDSTWSSWAGLSGEGPEENAVKSASPEARYLQVRVEMIPGGGASPRLQALTLTSRPFNRAPVVSDVEVPEGGEPPLSLVEEDDSDSTAKDIPAQDAAGDAGAIPASGTSPTGSEPDSAPKQRWVTFESSDPDGDPLRVMLHARQAEPPSTTVDVPLIGDGTSADDLGGASAPVSPLAWDDRALPEGRWTLLVRISDEAANPAGTDLAAEAESPAFTVDHTPPSLTPGEAERGSIRVVATDRLSPIRKAEYSTDGKIWRAAGCADGILDQRTEQLVVPVAGGRNLILRVSDAAGNSARITLPGPARNP